MLSVIIGYIGSWVSIVTGVISLLTFLYVTVGGVIFKKKVILWSLGGEPVRFRVQLRNFNVQQITNIVSANYFNGGVVPPIVRQEIIEITAPTVMKELKSHKLSCPTIFVNLTNHPSTKWGERQLSEAKKYGDVIDIPFPKIDASCDEKIIAQLANEYTSLILKDTSGYIPVVHVMGEMSFTIALVRRLRCKGIRCLASTTIRDVDQRDNGEKISTFKFVRFRDYE